MNAKGVFFFIPSFFLRCQGQGWDWSNWPRNSVKGRIKAFILFDFGCARVGMSIRIPGYRLRDVSPIFFSYEYYIRGK